MVGPHGMIPERGRAQLKIPRRGWCRGLDLPLQLQGWECRLPSRDRHPPLHPRRYGLVCEAPQASYLKESDTRVRNAATLPFSNFMSICVTSATRRSRSDPAAVSTALRPASSHDLSLTPTTSTIL